FTMRIHDPLKQWKLSPMDVESRSRWELYTKAKEDMLEHTHIPESPWWVVEAVDKKRARLNCISHFLSQIPYEEVAHTPVVLPPRVRNPDYHRGPIPKDMYVPSRYRRRGLFRNDLSNSDEQPAGARCAGRRRFGLTIAVKPAFFLRLSSNCHTRFTALE